MYQEMTSCKIFIKIQHQKPIKTPLSSKFLPGVLEKMEVPDEPGVIPDEPGVGVRWYGLSFRSFCESFINIKHQKPCKDSTCPPSLFQESWRMWRFLKNLEKAETLSRLHLSSKSLPGVLRMWRFLKNLETSETLSRLHLSSKSGVLEDMEVPDEPGGGVIW